MSYRVFAMDTYFYHSLGAYEFDARCEMLKELGYDATYLTAWSQTAWNDVPRLAMVKAKHGLDVAGVYATLDITANENDKIVRLVESLEGCKQIELSVVAGAKTFALSDPADDGAAIRWLNQLLPIAERRGIHIALYPHFSFWLERIEDAVRLCRQLRHPNLHTVFPSFHWYAVDGTKLGARLAEAQPFLTSVNLCGSRSTGKKDGGLPATIEPLDEGELDNFALVGLLRQNGYTGMIGFQGFSVGGDVYGKLKRSLAAFRDMERRLEKHPEWAQLRFA